MYLMIQWLLCISKFFFLFYYRAAVQEGDWQKAAAEMKDSTWASQVKARADRLIERMKNVETA